MTGDVAGKAVQAVAAKVLADRITEYRKAVNADLAETAGMQPGDVKAARLDNGVKVGSVGMTEGRVTARVSDEAAFHAFVQDNYPGELVTTIRPAFVAAILKAAADRGAPVDARTGEVVPGVTVGKGDPYLTVRVEQSGLPALVDAVRAGQHLALNGDTE